MNSGFLNKTRAGFLFLLVGLLVAIAFIQAGISQGRSLERMEISREQEANRALIKSLRERVREVETRAARLTYKHNLMLAIIACESSGRHDGVWGDGGKSYGIVQFQKRTFDYLSARSGIEGLDWKDKNDQLALLSWALDNEHGNNWTCYKKAVKKIEREARHG